jgi:ABC-2 type transport system permease protein
VVWLTWRQMFAYRRLWIGAGIALLPSLFVIAFTLLADAAAERTGFFVTLQREIVIGTLLPLAALIFGIAAFGGEVEDGTLIYLLVKPVPRWRIVVSKYVATALATIAVMAPAVLIPWAMLRDERLTAAVAQSLLTGVAVGALLYTALFLALGLLAKRAFTLGLAYVVLFEGVLSRSGAEGVKALSVREFAVSVAQSVGDVGATLGTASVPMDTVRTVGTALFIGALGVATWKLSRYQLAERL